MTPRRTPPARRTAALYAAVALVAAAAYWLSLRNGFVFDDVVIVRANPFVHAPGGWWRAFTAPYWPPEWGGYLYRPLVIASYWLDYRFAGTVAWLHGVNILWHAAVCVAVAALARRWSDDWGALAAGLLFAVHPVHVEAVANLVGRAELIAAFFAVAAVAAALVWDRLWLAVAAWLLALGAKENAAVVPALVGLGWLLGIGRPGRRRMLAYLGAALIAGAAYGIVRETVLQPYARFQNVAGIFLGASPVQIRLTAVAALADVARLLLFPLHLRVDYSPLERTLVTSPFDVRFVLGLVVAAAWAGLIALAWRRGRKVEAFGLGWVGIAYGPVANLLFPVGILVAERTLYLPSVGLVIAAAAWLSRARAAAPAPRRLDLAVAALVLAGGVRTVLRVPVWRTNETFVLSILEDSPRSYVGPLDVGQVYLEQRRWDKALAAFQDAARVWPWDARLYLMQVDAALHLGRTALADSLLATTDRVCAPCEGMYRAEAGNARVLGDTAIADFLLDHYRKLGRP